MPKSISNPNYCYVVMLQDHHTDPVAHLFSTLIKAVDYAQEIMIHNKESMQYVDNTLTQEELEKAGWLYYGCYNPEGDCVWIVRTEIK